jgi:hypothetical protein
MAAVNKGSVFQNIKIITTNNSGYCFPGSLIRILVSTQVKHVYTTVVEVLQMSKGTNVTITRFHIVKHSLFIPEQNSEVLTTVISVIKRKYFRRFAGNCWTRQSRVQQQQ